jgi:AcrR family transcriptional regulator
MARWEPGSRGRLEAALALWSEPGVDNVAAPEITPRAGLTEQTFFRSFADQREVLFSGASTLQELSVVAVANPPVSAVPIDAVRELSQLLRESLDELKAVTAG